MLPFVAEPLSLLKLRFPLALEKVWHVTDPMPDRPGLHREHVFDFEDGLRLLISKDDIGGVTIHVSASWEYTQPKNFILAFQHVMKAYKELGGIGTLRFLGFSAKGIPHWIVEKEG